MDRPFSFSSAVLLFEYIILAPVLAFSLFLKHIPVQGASNFWLIFCFYAFPSLAAISPNSLPIYNRVTSRPVGFPSES